MQRLIFGTVFTRVLSTGINFLIALLIARHCGPSVKGDVTLLITTIWFFVFISNILGGQALVYLIPRHKTEILLIPAYAWLMVVAISGFIFLKLTNLIHATHIPAVALISLFSSVIIVHQTILLGKKQITNANLLQVISLMVQLAGVLFCFYFMRISDVYAYIYATLAAYGLAAFISVFLVARFISFSGMLKKLSWKDLRTSLKFGSLYQMTEVLQLLNLRYYFYQLGIQQGIQYLGVFSIGISILEAVWIIPRSISTVHYVSTANMQQVEGEVSRTVQLVKFSFLLSFVALLVIWLVPGRVYSFIFGPGFADVKHIIRFLFPGVLLYCIPIVISSFYLGIGKYKQLILAYSAGVVALYIASRFLIPKYVMSGAGLAATISFAVTTLILFTWFVVEYGISLSQFAFGKNDWQVLNKLIKPK